MKKHRQNDVSKQAAEIAQTQQDIAATFAALQAQLAPRQLLAATGNALAHGAEETATQAAQSIHDAVTKMLQQVPDTALISAILGTMNSWLGSLAQPALHKGQSDLHTPTQNAPVDTDQFVSQLRETVQQRMGDVQHQATDSLQHAQQQVEQLLREHPWQLGTLAVLVGLGLALAFPESEAEQAWLSKSRDMLVENVQTFLHTLFAAPPPVADPSQATING